MTKFYKIMFTYFLMIGTMISISAFSWMGMWIGMEINLLSFIPLMNDSKNAMSIESSLKYFITQAIASSVILFMIILSSNIMLLKLNMMNLIINSALLTKMGAAPFHFWLPEVMEGLDWMNCLIMLTWQKITPMILVMYNINFSIFFIMVIVFCMMISSIMSLNQISLRKIMAFSSINHIAWMLSSMFFFESIWMIYFMVYFIISFNIVIMFKFLNIFYMKQFFMLMSKMPMMKMFFTMNFLSLGGLPPFLGFLPKWLTIQMLIMNNSLFLTFTMIILTLIMLFIYMRISFSSLVLNMTEINFNLFFKPNYYLISIINFISLFSLILITLLFNFT